MFEFTNLTSAPAMKQSGLPDISTALLTSGALSASVITYRCKA